MKYISRVYSFLQIVSETLDLSFARATAAASWLASFFCTPVQCPTFFFVLIVVPPVSEISTGKSWSELLLSFKDMCVLFSKSRKGWHSSIISEQVLGMALKGHEREASMRAAAAGHSKPKIRKKRLNIEKQLQCFHQTESYSDQHTSEHWQIQFSVFCPTCAPNYK